MRVALARGPAHAGEREAPDQRTRDRQRGVRPERHAEDPGRNRDERAHDRRDPSQQYAPRAPALEPPLGALEPLGAQVEEASVLFRERPAAAPAGPPA